MKIVFAGNNLRAIKCLNYLIKKKINVILAIGHPKKKTDTKYYSSIEKISKKEKLNYLYPNSLNYYKECLSIPIYYSLNYEEQNKVIKSIKKLINE